MSNAAVATTSEQLVFIPQINKSYQQYGNYEVVENIIKSNKFWPIWITGLSGNGKTEMVEQACAQLNREYIRINFTAETDESDLIGSIRLSKDGEATVTSFHEGPVVDALRRGAILLLDEIDVGHVNKVMCLQSVLEGKGVYIKATKEYVKPAKGFNIFATSNTKGQGSTDGKFIGTNIMNGAFLDRFAGMIYQPYPPADIEEKILTRHVTQFFFVDHGIPGNQIDPKQAADLKKYISRLVEWAAKLRKSYDDGAIEDVITTRTLINIAKGYEMLGDHNLAMKLACERYSDDVKESFIEYYDMLFNVDEEVLKNAPEIDDNEISFKISDTPF